MSARSSRRSTPPAQTTPPDEPVKVEAAGTPDATDPKKASPNQPELEDNTLDVELEGVANVAGEDLIQVNVSYSKIELVVKSLVKITQKLAAEQRAGRGRDKDLQQQVDDLRGRVDDLEKQNGEKDAALEEMKKALGSQDERLQRAENSLDTLRTPPATAPEPSSASPAATIPANLEGRLDDVEENARQFRDFINSAPRESTPSVDVPKFEALAQRVGALEDKAMDLQNASDALRDDAKTTKAATDKLQEDVAGHTDAIDKLKEAVNDIGSRLQGAEAVMQLLGKPDSEGSDKAMSQISAFTDTLKDMNAGLQKAHEDLNELRIGLEKLREETAPAETKQRLADLEDGKADKSALDILGDRVEAVERKSPGAAPLDDSELQDRLNHLQGLKLDDTLANLARDIDALNGRVAALPSEDDIESLRKRLHDVEARPVGASGAVVSPTELSDMEDKLNKRIDGAEDKNESLSGDVRQLQRKVEVILNSAMAPTTSPRGSVSGANTDVLTGLVNSVVKDVEELKQRVNETQPLAKSGAKDAAAALAMAKPLEAVVDQLRAETKKLGEEATALAGTAKRLDDVKAPKKDVLDLGTQISTLRNLISGLKQPAAQQTHQARPPSGASKGQVDALSKRLEEIFNMALLHDRKLDTHAKIKADSEQLPPIFDRLKALEANLGAAMSKADDAIRAGNAGRESADLASEVQRGLEGLVNDVSRDREWAKVQVLEIRAIIEHIHISKVDANMVANKADRDYVENSLEKLMREVEQVVNASNAGLVDTLDKSLTILRDMIDGKAGKGDLQKLKSLVGREGEGNGEVPEGITGYKSYRCLGCNRTVDQMRPRPMGVSFMNFTNRLPQHKPLPPGSPQANPQVAGLLTHPTSP